MSTGFPRIPYALRQDIAAEMEEQRRHQRIRFANPPPVRIGYGGTIAEGRLENLSLSGFMVRTSVPLEVGKNFGCEFSVLGSSRIDAVAVTVSRLGSLCGARFLAGPINSLLIKDAIEEAIESGQASCVSTHILQGRKIMVVAGGLNATLENDFNYALTKAGIDELDLSAVTRIDEAGLALCKNAMRNHGITIGARSECFMRAWKA